MLNCLGAFLGIRAALGQLRAADGAAIVNTCSTGAIRPFPNHIAYGSAKWALRGLTQAAAAELAPAGIRVNAVFPGPIATPMLDDATQARLAATSISGRIEAAEHTDAQGVRIVEDTAPGSITVRIYRGAQAEIDPFRDEAIEYALRLLRDGVGTELHVFPRTCHGFESLLPDWSTSQRLFELQGDALRRAWAA